MHGILVFPWTSTAVKIAGLERAQVRVGKLHEGKAFKITKFYILCCNDSPRRGPNGRKLDMLAWHQ